MPRHDDYYQVTDRIHPHFSHYLQCWDDGAWRCVDCEGFACVGCHQEDVAEEDGTCGECLSEQAEFYFEEKGGQG